MERCNAIYILLNSLKKDIESGHQVIKAIGIRGELLLTPEKRNPFPCRHAGCVIRDIKLVEMLLQGCYHWPKVIKRGSVLHSQVLI